MKTIGKAIVYIFVGFMLLSGIATGKPIFFILSGLILFSLWMSGRKKKQNERETDEATEAAALQARTVPPYQRISAAAFLREPPSEYVAFDLETTGLSPRLDRIIEIGAVYVQGGKIVRSFSQLVNPDRHIPEAASNVNHITDQMVKHCPKIGSALRDFAEFVGGASVIAAHNATFDADFLMAAAQYEGVPFSAAFFDTLELARKVWPDLSNHKLGTVCANIGYSPKDAHRAEADAQAVHEIIQAALRDYPKIEAKKAEERAREKQRREQETLDAIRITATDRAMFANRCPLSDVLPADDYAAVQKGMGYYAQGDALKRIGNLEDALLLYNKARYYGYNVPALYESYAVTFRKLGRFQDEVDILDEYMGRNPKWKNEKIIARRDRALELLNKSNEENPQEGMQS